MGQIWKKRSRNHKRESTRTEIVSRRKKQKCECKNIKVRENTRRAEKIEDRTTEKTKDGERN